MDRRGPSRGQGLRYASGLFWKECAVGRREVGIRQEASRRTRPRRTVSENRHVRTQFMQVAYWLLERSEMTSVRRPGCI
jgi:hypothetical protein